MRRAIEIAAHGPRHGVNPRVGCVIINPAGDIIAEGWHRGAGTPHAEVVALSSLAPGAARGATAIVSLEPCNHTGRTGPCADALIEAGIARVIYAVADPGRHSGGGAASLRAAGVEVEAGLLEAEGEDALGDWLTTARLGRPLITVKWAQSIDGRAAAADGSSQWITGPDARADVHKRRSEADGIAVGTGTLLADDPALTARTPSGDLYEHQPIPVVFGNRPVPDGARLHEHPHDPLVVTGENLAADLRSVLAAGIRSLFVEGGPTLISALIAAGYVDTFLIYLAPALIGGPRVALTDVGVSSIVDTRRLEFTELTRLGDDLLVIAQPRAVSPKGKN